MQGKIAGFISGFFSTRTPDKSLLVAFYNCRKRLEKANRRIFFLEYQLRQSSIAFENLKKAQNKSDAVIAAEEKKNTSAKRTRLLSLARKHHLPETASGFGGKKIIFSNDFLEKLFQGGMCEKLIERLIVSINDFCQYGQLASNAFNPRPLNGKIRSVPVGATIISITNKYRLIFRVEEKNGIVVFYKLKRRKSNTYR